MSSLLCFRRWVSPLKQLNRRHSLLLLFSYSTTSHENKSTQPLPPPIQVSLTESAGRGVFAARKIGAGDQLHTAMPLVSHPSLSLVHSVCYFCLRKLAREHASSSSSSSSQVHFCNNECRQQAKAFYDVEELVDWSRFDEHCRKQGLKYPLLVKRLACMVLSGAASAECLDILQPARLLRELILEMEDEFNLLKSCLVKANFKDEGVAFLTKEWYTGVLARIRINAFRIELVGAYEDLFLMAAASVEAEASVGNAVYMLPSFYNHDCDPNVHIIWIDNVNARLKALRDIEEGEELRICYIDVSMDHSARQNILFEGFGFRCACARCISGD